MCYTGVVFEGIAYSLLVYELHLSKAVPVGAGAVFYAIFQDLSYLVQF
jgi:hypothetical protein